MCIFSLGNFHFIANLGYSWVHLAGPVGVLRFGGTRVMVAPNVVPALDFAGKSIVTHVALDGMFINPRPPVRLASTVNFIDTCLCRHWTYSASVKR